MGEVDLNSAEVTLLSRGKKRIKRLDGSYAEAITLEKFVRVTLSDGTQYLADLKLIPADIFAPGTEAHTVKYEHFFLEAANPGDNIVHEKRGYI